MACALNLIKSNFELVGRKYFRCLIAVQDFKKFEFKTFKTSYERTFSSIRIVFLKKCSNVIIKCFLEVVSKLGKYIN